MHEGVFHIRPHPTHTAMKRFSLRKSKRGSKGKTEAEAEEAEGADAAAAGIAEGEEVAPAETDTAHAAEAEQESKRTAAANWKQQRAEQAEKSAQLTVRYARHPD